MTGRDDSDNFPSNQSSSDFQNGGTGSRPAVSETGQFPSTLDIGEYEDQNYYYEPSAEDRADFIPRKPEKSWWERLSFAAKAVVIVAPIMTLIYVFILVFILVTSTREVLATPTSATNVAATNNALRPTNTLPVLQLRSPLPSPVGNPGGPAVTNLSNIPTVTPAPTPTLLPTPAPTTAPATVTAGSTPTPAATTGTASNSPATTSAAPGTGTAISSPATATRTVTPTGATRTPSAATPTLAPAATVTTGAASSTPTTTVIRGTPTTSGTTAVVSGTPLTTPTTAPNSPVTTR